MKNGKPSNLFPLLRAVKHPLGRHQMAFEKHFCNGMLKSFGRGKPVWDANGCSNLKQLKRLVSSNLLHLTKDQCLTLPPLKRQRYEVPISHRNRLQYIQSVKDLVSQNNSHPGWSCTLLIFVCILSHKGKSSRSLFPKERSWRGSPWCRPKTTLSMFVR